MWIGVKVKREMENEKRPKGVGKRKRGNETAYERAGA